MWVRKDVKQRSGAQNKNQSQDAIHTKREKTQERLTEDEQKAVMSTYILNQLLKFFVNIITVDILNTDKEFLL